MNGKARSAELETEAQDWLVRSLSDEFSESEAERLFAWRGQSPDHEKAWQDTVTLWKSSEGLRDVFAQGIENKAIESSPAPRTRHFGLRGAAQALAMAAVIAIVIVKYDDLLIWLRADYSTTYGEQRDVKLPDGSAVKLNTGSAIALDYSAQTRALTLLRGEAVFDIRTNPDRPFVVHALGGTVTVLGTVFVVRSSNNETMVTVEEGRVKVAPAAQSTTHPSQQQATLLTTAQRISYAPGQSPQPVREVQPKTIATWRHKIITIEDLSFGEAIAELNRYTPGRILLASDTSDLDKVSGRFSTKDIAGAVDALAATHNLTVRRLTPYLTILH